MSEASSRNHRATAPASPAIGQETSEMAAAPASKPAVTAKHLVDVDAVLFRAASECRSFEETRYYLNGVYIYPHPVKGVLMVGTDGYRMMVVHDESGKCEKPIIVEVAPKGLTNAKPPKDLKEPRMRLVLAEDKHVIVGTYRSLGPAIIDGTFPDYVRVLRPVLEALRENKFAPASFNPEYLAGFAKAAQIFEPGGHKGIRVVSTNESDAALVLFAGAPEAFGILMPMRASLGNGFPAWMQPVLEPPPPPAPKVKSPAKKPTKAKPAKVSKRKGRAR